MKTHAMDKAKTVATDCLYPFATSLFERGYPSTRQFQVVRNRNGDPTGIKARVAFDSRTRIAKVSGYALSERRQHTFQISSRIHLYDRWFCGLLRHSCSPNVYFDTHYLELWAVVPIAVGSWLTIDYADSSDILPHQFACHCGAPNCRGWIKGRGEQINAEGLRVLESKRGPEYR
ncbi:SET domain-containing protein-lysine N-methyltransferase [Pseudomonas veronii]|uniref:SET domain-containing protein-lysine N-methyltransferase n=1 Tax=Pseudomonas veronii TaxID=76761 RepID=UPI00143D554B|nr:SET domain-containing protein-lysine N-methyltransferase [Pseudomonas veronii]